MEAPDKIYVHEISAEELTENLPYHVCYIRKDALLEWAKEKYNQASKNADETDERYHYGEVNAFEELIDKLNTL